jgi:hypothetical protein
MPFDVDHSVLCPACPLGECIEDRRANPVRGRTTQFRLKQNTALACTFGEFVPGTDNDPEPGRPFDDYLVRFRRNAELAGKTLFGRDFGLGTPALAKVEGDVYELLDAAALWNAAATWNRFMDGGVWDSKAFTAPKGAVQTPDRRLAIVRLPRGYDATKLFQKSVRANILAHSQALKLRGMELGLSVPDIVGIRLPSPLTEEMDCFTHALASLEDANRALLETAYTYLEGTLVGRSFLFAIAVKRTTRSDRLYQPLFEANILKYLIEVVLQGAAFRFYVHLGSFEGADVEGHYRAASLISLMRGGEPTLAVNSLVKATHPQTAAQTILNDLPLFPL